ncbi:MAG TPA: menaquinone-dependent protoporphyrinogen IX dehydrogenase [Burkholderiales bacterium]|nr:menaquinone-dependent protoporphyrinogen IX dehydrogenase [Burkholderiales bacterium]
MARILIVYSTTDGHTREICNRLRGVIEQQAHQVALAPFGEVADSDLERCDRIVVGASIRYGKHRPALMDFIERNAAVLNRKPSAFFSVSVVARKPNRNQPHTNPYVRKLLRRIAWRPREVGVFAGKIDYPRYGVLERLVIRFIMWITGGPTDPNATVEFTDWRKVEEFGKVIAGM